MTVLHCTFIYYESLCELEKYPLCSSCSEILCHDEALFHWKDLVLGGTHVLDFYKQILHYLYLALQKKVTGKVLSKEEWYFFIFENATNSMYFFKDKK